MPRVTHVKRTQQRYAMIKTDEIIDMNRTTKRGRAVEAHKSVPDKTRPLPPRDCDYCRKPIEVGTPHKWIAPRSGPYGGRKRFRHEGCPTWHVWEYSDSLSAQIAHAQYSSESDLPSAVDQGDFEAVRDDFATAIRELAEMKAEAADNMESGFGHETYQSQEIRDVADQLESWADEIESWQEPDYPEADDGGEPSDDQLEEWRDEARDGVQELIDQSPV